MAATSSTRETILAKIRRALAQPVPLPFPKQDAGGELYAPPAEDLTVVFAQEFTRLLGRFAYAEHEKDLIHQVRSLVEERGWKEVYCVEEQIKAMQPPKPKGDPAEDAEKAKAQADLAIGQQKAQAEKEKMEREAALETQRAAMEQEQMAREAEYRREEHAQRMAELSAKAEYNRLMARIKLIQAQRKAASFEGPQE